MGECLSVAFDARALAFLAAVVAVSCASTWAAIRYAHRRRMLDLPGHRRSHRAPTPRGGGIAIVLAMLAAVVALPLYDTGCGSSRQQAGMIVAIALVALVGWIDDHRPLSARWRLLAHLLAAAIVLHSGIGAFAIGGTSSGLTAPWTRAMTWGAWIAVAWSINLHNFMDGIDGLLAQQAMFVGAGLALLAWGAGQGALALAAACLATASLGFWCLNRSPARIFMGDVGSGSVGLLIFAFTAMLWRVETRLLWPALILSSAFVADASLTLLSRFCRGRRWYTAHREHLYQWLVRCGLTHAGGGAIYMTWNLLLAAPLAWLAFSHPALGLPTTMGTYLAAAVLWLLLKRRCLRRHPPKDRHVAA